jgi:uncharacterized protein (TIGR02284 family)
MQANEKTIETLNDLIKINNDRIEGYQRAIKESKDLDIDLKATFERMISESTQYKQELTELAQKHDGDIDVDDTTTSGKIYRAWMDVKATFSGHDRKAILESCEFGEDAAQRAYESAINVSEELLPEANQMIAEQQKALKSAHDLIKKYRDSHK